MHAITKTNTVALQFNLQSEILNNPRVNFNLNQHCLWRQTFWTMYKVYVGKENALPPSRFYLIHSNLNFLIIFIIQGNSCVFIVYWASRYWLQGLK